MFLEAHRRLAFGFPNWGWLDVSSNMVIESFHMATVPSHVVIVSSQTVIVSSQVIW